MAEDNEIKKTLQQRNIQFGEQEKFLDGIIETGKKFGENIRSIVVDAEKTKEQVKINKEINEILSKNVQYVPSGEYAKLTPLIDQDKKFTIILKEYESQIGKFHTDFNIVDPSFNVIPFLAASSTSGSIYFSSFLDHPTLKQELIKVDAQIFENIEFIKNELKQFSPDRSKDFESVIKDWFATSDSKLKYKSLLSLCSIIFNQILDNLCLERNYSKAIWYKLSTDKRGRYCQVKFFVLGYSNENQFSVPQKTQIDSISKNMQQYFHEMSEYGKTGFSGSSLDVLFEKVITNFRVMIQLRKTFYKSTI